MRIACRNTEPRRSEIDGNRNNNTSAVMITLSTDQPEPSTDERPQHSTIKAAAPTIIYTEAFAGHEPLSCRDPQTLV